MNITINFKPEDIQKLFLEEAKKRLPKTGKNYKVVSDTFFNLCGDIKIVYKEE